MTQHPSSNSRSIPSRALAVALAAALWLAAGHGAAAEWDPSFDLSGTGKLTAEHLGSLKIPVRISARMCCAGSEGTWSAHDLDEGTLFNGHFWAADTNGKKWDAVFDSRSLASLAGSLQRVVREEAGIDAIVVSISQRRAILKLTSKDTKAELKLTFDILALVNGQVRTAKYVVPLKGTADMPR